MFVNIGHSLAKGLKRGAELRTLTTTLLQLPASDSQS